jgi:phosphoenolpyruvate carboxylase
LLTIFHGRGTIARRGTRQSPFARLREDQRFRVTEQGEIIASRYSNPDLAHRRLEQIVSAVVLASIPQKEQVVPEKWRTTINEMSKTAQHAYRSLVYETPGFVEFWMSATPLDEIKRLQIGSRPASRAKVGFADGVDQIR